MKIAVYLMLLSEFSSACSPSIQKKSVSSSAVSLESDVEGQETRNALQVEQQPKSEFDFDHVVAGKDENENSNLAGKYFVDSPTSSKIRHIERIPLGSNRRYYPVYYTNYPFPYSYYNQGFNNVPFVQELYFRYHNFPPVYYRSMNYNSKASPGVYTSSSSFNSVQNGRSVASTSYNDNGKIREMIVVRNHP